MRGNLASGYLINTQTMANKICTKTNKAPLYRIWQHFDLLNNTKFDSKKSDTGKR